ncbi:transcriptional regulator [Rhizobium sp. ACO-34A]|nr:LysR substrate-binding domain-containing protein [Rhizobium sp. ACO-34A]ATN34702.1 transcriptional regulator [Rhizobium sp. ACO-34A]
MKRGRLPLTALRSFEAAGRLGSFTAASQELYVSQAAISRQVRELETTLGIPLFERGHRRVTLTQSGRQLLESLTSAFDSIVLTLDEIAGEPQRQALAISSEPGFAASWLAPNLRRFNAAYPDIDLTVDSDQRLIDFRNSGAEIAIRHSIDRDAWPRTEARKLIDVLLIAVTAPSLLVSGPPILTAKDILDRPILHEENRDNWQNWLSGVGVRTKVPAGPVYTDSALVLQGALRGDGIALVDRLHAEEALENGSLVQLFDHALPFGAFWIVARDFDHLSRPANAFIDWLETSIRPQIAD